MTFTVEKKTSATIAAEPGSLYAQLSKKSQWVVNGAVDNYLGRNADNVERVNTLRAMFSRPETLARLEGKSTQGVETYLSR